MAASIAHVAQRVVLVLGLLLAPLPAATSLSATEALAAPSLSGDLAPLTARTPPTFDRSLVLLGCMGGLVLGTASAVLPPVAGWAAAGIWMGGLGTMILRAGFGCVYGGLGGAVASLARATLGWIDTTWRAWTGRPLTRPLPIEGVTGT